MNASTLRLFSDGDIKTVAIVDVINLTFPPGAPDVDYTPSDTVLAAQWHLVESGSRSPSWYVFPSNDDVISVFRVFLVELMW